MSYVRPLHTYLAQCDSCGKYYRLELIENNFIKYFPKGWSTATVGGMLFHHDSKIYCPKCNMHEGMCVSTGEYDA